jgi:fucose 4-O-acetylase-like acetyltransferase
MLVVIGHCNSNSQPEWYTFLRGVIYTFHMPLFFAISGFLWYAEVKRVGAYDFRTIIYKKSIRLLLPYVVISTIVYPIKTILSKYSYRDVDFGIYNYILSIVYPSNNPVIYFWGLPTLF